MQDGVTARDFIYRGGKKASFKRKQKDNQTSTQIRKIYVNQQETRTSLAAPVGATKFWAGRDQARLVGSGRHTAWRRKAIPVSLLLPARPGLPQLECSERGRG